MGCHEQHTALVLFPFHPLFNDYARPQGQSVIRWADWSGTIWSGSPKMHRRARFEALTDACRYGASSGRNISFGSFHGKPSAMPRHRHVPPDQFLLPDMDGGNASKATSIDRVPLPAFEEITSGLPGNRGWQFAPFADFICRPIRLVSGRN